MKQFLKYSLFFHSQVPLDESYSKGEKDSALDAYAMSMLLARDAHLKTTSFHNKDSIIAQIVEELSEHTALSVASHKQHREASHSMSSMSVSSLSTGSPHIDRVYAKLTALTRLTHPGNHSGNLLFLLCT